MAHADGALADVPGDLEAFERWQDRQPEAHPRAEFLAGQVRLMAPERAYHGQLKLNITIALRALARARSCEAYVDSLAVKSRTTEASVIPDALVVCPPVGRDETAVEDALVVVEVLSPSNTGPEMADKLEVYAALPGLRHYLVVHGDRPLVVHHTRDAAKAPFLIHLHTDGEIVLTALNGAIALDALYDGVDMPE
ncbi:MAG: Uma2 family endonuclease [Pseudomonadota bacterium]